MRKFIIYSIGLFSITFGACKSDKSAVVADSPETVIEKWQNYVNHNQYAEAKALSINDAYQMVASLEMTQAMSTDSVETFETKFLEKNCSTTNDSTTICHCVVEELGEQMNVDYSLLLKNGFWLVDFTETPELESTNTNSSTQEFDQVITNQDKKIIQ